MAIDRTTIGTSNPYFGVPIKDEKLGRGLKRKCFPQLLNDPSGRRMPRNIEMQHAPTTVADDEKAVEDAKGYGWHGEEIHGGNGFSVIPQNRKPSLGGLWICRGSSHPTGNRPLGNIEPKHQEFTVDTRRAPGWVLDHHAKDQIPHLF